MRSPRHSGLLGLKWLGLGCLVASILLADESQAVKIKNVKNRKSKDLDHLFEDVDYCAKGLHKCHIRATCIPDPPHVRGGLGYSCECDNGWKGDGFKCENRDECQERLRKSRGGGACGRHAQCRDTVGSFVCACDEGFEMTDEGECKDVDECLEGFPGCAPLASCKNTVGGFDCRCPKGYNGDGRTFCQDMCQPAGPAQRMDCFPDGGGDATMCAARGCCWDSDSGTEQPSCYYPLPANSYRFAGREMQLGIKGKLECSGQNRYGDGHGGNGGRPYHIGPFGSEVCPLDFDVRYESPKMVRVRITDSRGKRWEVPSSLYDHHRHFAHGEKLDYQVNYTSYPFGFAVSRVSTRETLFNSTPVDGRISGLSFEEQFIGLGTVLETHPLLYGIGQHSTPFRLPTGQGAKDSETYTLFAKDQLTPEHTSRGGDNQYGSHPFYMQVSRKSGQAHGVLMFNSNAMDMMVTKDTLSYRMTGGIVDMLFFLGPTPADVVKQYTDFVGKPALPPFWSLGFHLCRWGYNSVAKTREVADQMRAAKMPQDAQWNDIDYMQAFLDFTLDPVRYPTQEMKSFVSNLHSNGQHYVMIVDPGISTATRNSGAVYEPYDDGIRLKVFVQNASSVPLTAKVWPGLVHFPDFLHPNAKTYWRTQLERFHDLIPYDGIWLDMNEPSSFCDGECPNQVECGDSDGVETECSSGLTDEDAERTSFVYAPWKLRRKGGHKLDPSNPPYLPGGEKLEQKTIKMNAKHCIAVPGSTNCTEELHYNVHNLYGFSESKMTSEVASEFMGKRPLLISRSTFPGSGKVTGMWLGDNKSLWQDLVSSISGILTMGILGIPLVGADICGFQGPTTRELCIRWTQVGAFYPFSRNHNDLQSPDQEPSKWDEEAQDIMRGALETRYTLLSYLYSCFYESHLTGVPVARPLVMEFNGSERMAVADVGRQFMLGPSLLITPVLEEGAEKVTGAFPAKVWFDLLTGEKLIPESGAGKLPGWLDIAAPISKIPVHVRGGRILPTQNPGMTSSEVRRSSYRVIVAPDEAGRAHGDLFLDDGLSLRTVELGAYSLIKFSSFVDDKRLRGNVSCSVVTRGYDPELDPAIGHELGYEEIRILGFKQPAGKELKFKVNGKNMEVSAIQQASGGYISIRLDNLAADSTPHSSASHRQGRKIGDEVEGHEPMLDTPRLPSVLETLVVSWSQD